MRPTMMFSIASKDLDFFARPNESDHQGKKADGCEDVEDVWHGVRIRLFLSPGERARKIPKDLLRGNRRLNIVLAHAFQQF